MYILSTLFSLLITPSNVVLPTNQLLHGEYLMSIVNANVLYLRQNPNTGLALINLESGFPIQYRKHYQLIRRMGTLSGGMHYAKK